MILSRIIESMSKVKYISISGFSFQNQNTASAYRSARKAAVDDAYSKAKQYASLTSKNLRGVRKIEDQNQDRYIPFPLDTNSYVFRAQALEIPYGKVSVSAGVEIQWNI